MLFLDMDRNTAKIIADNYVSMYRIRTKDMDGSIIEKIIERDYKKQNYDIYKKIYELATNSFVITSENWFDVETDAEQNENC